MKYLTNPIILFLKKKVKKVTANTANTYNKVFFQPLPFLSDINIGRSCSPYCSFNDDSEEFPYNHFNFKISDLMEIESEDPFYIII